MTIFDLTWENVSPLPTYLRNAYEDSALVEKAEDIVDIAAEIAEHDCKLAEDHACDCQKLIF